MTTDISKEELQYPEKVYKYRDWTNLYHRRILNDNEVYMSSPKMFNDPFDCRITTNFLTLNTFEEKKKYLDYLFKRHQFDVDLSDLEKERVYKERLEEFVDDIQGFQDRADKMSIEWQDDVFGILSLSCVWDNLLMWSHYGNNHTGVCIGFHEEKLRSSGLFGNGGKVLYNSAYPEIHPNQEIDEDEITRARRYFSMTHVKAEDWKYEEEYRLMTTYPHRNVSTDERKVNLANDFYAEIVLGCDFPNEDVAKMIEFGKQKQIPVYQGEKVPFQFKLKRIPRYQP